MAKKAFGKLAALLTIAGAAAAGISYLTKYRSFNKELDEDFHDFEDEDETEVPDSTMSRNYVSLHADKDEFLVAAGDMMNAAKDAASAAKNMVNRRSPGLMNWASSIRAAWQHIVSGSMLMIWILWPASTSAWPTIRAVT